DHRRAQPGARRHPQRTHLRPRPGDRAGDDEHLLDLPGRTVECQQRLDADSAYRAHINEALSGQGLSYEKGKDGWTNKNFLWVLVEDYGLDKLAEQVVRPLSGLRVGPFYGCYIVRPKERLGYGEHPDRDVYLEKVIT